MTRTKLELISKGRQALLDRLNAELKRESDEGSAEQFIEAELVIDGYLEAVAAGSDSVPCAEDLAFACAVLLAAAGPFTSQDLEVLSHLNAPEAGISLYAISRQISEIKARAIGALEKNLAGRAEETTSDADLF